MIFIIKSQGGTSILGGRGGGGGLGPVVKFRGKIWGKVQPSSPNKIWEVLLLQDANVGKESQFWGHLGVGISEIQRAKFGVFVTYISGGKVQGLLHEFQWQILGPNPPDLLIWKYPLGIKSPSR